MTFTRGTFAVGDGRISGAVQRGGDIHFFIDIDGMIVKRTMQVGRRGIGAQEFVSYSDEYTQTQNRAVSLWGNEAEVSHLG